MMRRLLVVAGLGLLAGSSGCTSDRRPSRAESAASTTISTAASLNRWDD